VGAKDVVNRFFPGGFADFQTMTEHRYATDFVRGVETQLVLSERSFPEKLQRRFGGKWVNNDFSQVSGAAVEDAIAKTLAIGSHRIDKLNHERGVKRETLKDWQEFAEKSLGWDTHEMKFLRWESFWNVWNTLGPGWDCICFSRKPIFNAETLRQY
jgi:hypothetical protein